MTTARESPAVAVFARQAVRDRWLERELRLRARRVAVITTLGTTYTLTSIESAPLDPTGLLGGFSLEPIALQSERVRPAPRSWPATSCTSSGARTPRTARCSPRSSTRVSIAAPCSGQFATTNSTLAAAPPQGAHGERDRQSRVRRGRDQLVRRRARQRRESAVIQPDGASLGGFAPVTGVQLQTPRQGHCAVVVGDQLFVIGGVSGTGAVTASVESAAINPDGTLMSFLQPSFVAPRRRALADDVRVGLRPAGVRDRRAVQHRRGRLGGARHG